MKKFIMISVLCVLLALAGGGFLLYCVIDSGFFTGASAKRSERAHRFGRSIRWAVCVRA